MTAYAIRNRPNMHHVARALLFTIDPLLEFDHESNCVTFWIKSSIPVYLLASLVAYRSDIFEDWIVSAIND